MVRVGVAGTALLAALALGGGDDARGAGAAYQVDTGVIGEPGSCKVESWTSWAANHDFFAAVSPACVVGLYRPVELSAQFSWLRSEGEWTTGVIPKLKTNILPGGGVGEWS